MRSSTRTSALINPHQCGTTSTYTNSSNQHTRTGTEPSERTAAEVFAIVAAETEAYAMAGKSPVLLLPSTRVWKRDDDDKWTDEDERSAREQRALEEED